MVLVDFFSGVEGTAEAGLDSASSAAGGTRGWDWSGAGVPGLVFFLLLVLVLVDRARGVATRYIIGWRVAWLLRGC